MKKIILPLEREIKQVKIEREKRDRKIISSDNWIYHDISQVREYEIVKECIQNILNNDTKILIRQIKGKLHSYKGQDKLKTLTEDENEFMNVTDVLKLLLDCNHKCYYCKTNVKLFYEKVREPIQWTLERLDNSFGHNMNNCVISCLKCNLSRRTMFHERYTLTKQLQNIIKKT
tara:strand:- start:68 stop:589 length:522 start_codon:yes stop_codon:yes gene_type:complete